MCLFNRSDYRQCVLDVYVNYKKKIQGYTGKIQCGRCSKKFTVLPMAYVKSEIKDEVKVESDWVGGTYSCCSDIGICCCYTFM